MQYDSIRGAENSIAVIPEISWNPNPSAAPVSSALGGESEGCKCDGVEGGGLWSSPDGYYGGYGGGVGGGPSDGGNGGGKAVSSFDKVSLHNTVWA